MDDHEMKTMLIEYMGKGFLDNIAALFKQDPSVYPFLGDMVGSEEIRVRLGAIALVEELAAEHRAELEAALPGIIQLLINQNPTIRGDAAYALGIIGSPNVRQALEQALQDVNPAVREAVRDALSGLR
jgi:HEAT repeat protein